SNDNSEMLKNYVHAWQLTRNEVFAAVARDIIRWMDAWLTDQEHGGFYGSQDADYSLDDDGDYFTWTLAETKAVLSGEELEVATLHYDIGEVGEMHHNHEKNVLHVTSSIEEIAQRLNKSAAQTQAILDSAKQKMHAARLKRPTPYVDKTVYVSWNSLCISAYLKAAQALHLEPARKFALRSLDRILSQGWNPQTGLQHVIAYSDPQAAKRQSPGVLDDYAFTVVACLDAYEATADLTYFNFARKIADFMISHFADQTGGGFFDIPPDSQALGALTAQRKALQDSPTPAGNPAAAIALLRLAAGEAVPQMLPPALAETIPNLPAVKQGKTIAVLCSGFTCQPPIADPAELEKAIHDATRTAAQAQPKTTTGDTAQLSRD